MSNNKSCSSADLKNLNQLFNKYCDPEEADMIGVDGTELFCRDLEVEPTDVVMLVLAWVGRLYALLFLKSCFFNKSISSVRGCVNSIERAGLRAGVN
jgi:hypothetical protein